VGAGESRAHHGRSPGHADELRRCPRRAAGEIRALRDEVLAKLGSASFVDVRSGEEYRGEKLAPTTFPRSKAQVPGHIPARPTSRG